jgi:hypothetical protein
MMHAPNPPIVNRNLAVAPSQPAPDLTQRDAHWKISGPTPIRRYEA